MRRINKHQYLLRQSRGKGVKRTKHGFFAMPKYYNWSTKEEKKHE